MLPGKYQMLRMIRVMGLFGLLAFSSAMAEEVKIKFNGLTLNANLEIADGRDFSDGMVLIVHGLWAHNKMEIIETTQQALLDIDQSSLAINLSLGIDNRHGFLDCNVEHRHTQEEALEEIQAWVDWLRSREVTDLVLLGHSRGGNHVMVYAAEQADPIVKQLLFLAPGTISTNKIFFTQRFGYHFDRVLQRAQAMKDAGRGDEIMPDTDFNYCPKARVTANSFLSYYSDQADDRFQNFVRYLPKITVPALIITGTEDDRQPEIEDNVRPHVDGQLIHLTVIEGAGHFFRDFNIEEAMEAAVEFLSTVTVSNRS